MKKLRKNFRSAKYTVETMRCGCICPCSPADPVGASSLVFIFANNLAAGIITTACYTE